MNGNIYLNYFQTGWSLHADVMIDLQKKFIEESCDKEDFVKYAKETFQLESPIAVLIWQSFDVYEGFLLNPRINNDDQ